MHLLSWTAIHLVIAGGFAALLAFLGARQSRRPRVLGLSYALALAGTLLATALVAMVVLRTVRLDWTALTPQFATSLVAALAGGVVGLWWAGEYRREA
ncbi:hypothetical protein NK718_19535 [Alsobacter sp. SYSU M60028]|uniref:Uncharacterized protein n=1 Tax=Alsobacter ponti TaxID=2962936 RepID=A0ABT1LGU8_9HYPH|nr:hypothetical protein [Alsobacter ponti]MCP8940724.1 hypothetical protein [Alsobacter ponti]